MTDNQITTFSELEEAWQRLLGRGHIPASVSELYDAVLTKRNMTEDKAELFARIWGKGVERKGMIGDWRVINGEQSIKHSELVEALMHLGWGGEPARRTAYNITCRVLDEREPKWKTGDIVRSGSGKIFIRQAEGDWADAQNANPCSRYQNLVGPLTKLGRTT